MLVDRGEALVHVGFGFCEALVDSVEALVHVVLHVGEALVNSSELLVGVVFGFRESSFDDFSEVAEAQIKRSNLIGDCLNMSIDNQMLTLQLVAQVSHGDDAVLRTAWCGGGLGHGHWLYHSYESCQVTQRVDVCRSVCAAPPTRSMNFKKIFGSISAISGGVRNPVAMEAVGHPHGQVHHGHGVVVKCLCIEHRQI